MPRQSKPFFREQTQSWYCSVKGKQIPLGKIKTEAFDKFYELMGRKDDLRSDSTSVYQLTQSYLDWCQKNKKPSTYTKHLHYLKSFIESTGKKLRVGQVRKLHLTKWLDSKTWTSTTKNDAMGIVKRAFNWATEEGYFSYNPIARVRKPPAKRRDIFYSAEQWQKIRNIAKGPVVDLLDFLWSTGCRPLEARILEAKHVHGDTIIFAAEESKGEKYQRVLFLTPESQKIVDKLIAKYPEGPLFRNRTGRAWTKDAVKCVLRRVSTKVGFRVIAYGARHGYATNALLKGVDAISVSHLMGHRSPAMVAEVYSHLAQNHEFLKKQARSAAQSTGEAQPAPPNGSAQGTA
jgi:integrase